MLDFNSHGHRSPKLKPEAALKAENFTLDNFNPERYQARPEREDSFKPLPAEVIDSFEQRLAGFTPQLLDPLYYLPSLDDLFKPFDPKPECPSAGVDEPPKNAGQPAADDFSEAPPLCPPESAQIIARAKSQAQEIIKNAQAWSEETMKKAQNEAAALVAAMKRRQEQNESQARREIEELWQSVRDKLKKADEFLAPPNNKRHEVKKSFEAETPPGEG